MNTSRSQDGPSRLTTIGHVLCSLLLIPVVALGWPALIGSACDLLNLPYGLGGDFGELITLTWDIGVGFVIGIQLSANVFRHLQGKRRSCNLWQIALVLFSVFCLLGTILFNFGNFDAFVIAFGNNALGLMLKNLLFIVLTMAPVIAWFWINVMRLVKMPRYA